MPEARQIGHFIVVNLTYLAMQRLRIAQQVSELAGTSGSSRRP